MTVERVSGFQMSLGRRGVVAVVARLELAAEFVMDGESVSGPDLIAQVACRTARHVAVKSVTNSVIRLSDCRSRVVGPLRFVMSYPQGN